MRKKLDTRFPASRIKKIMQTDEDVGKIALAVPLLVSKALELFLQDLCDRTYDITLKRGAKTISSLHLRQCVHSFNVFDFLKVIVCKVPEVGSSDAGVEDRSSRKRKTIDHEVNESDEESKKSKTVSIHSGRGRGRGRGREHRRGSGDLVGSDRDSTHLKKCEDESNLSPQNHHENHAQAENGLATLRDFDLNLDLDENGEATVASTSTFSGSVTMTAQENMQEYPAWLPFTGIENTTIAHVQLTLVNQTTDEEEDYDNED